MKNYYYFIILILLFLFIFYNKNKSKKYFEKKISDSVDKKEYILLTPKQHVNNYVLIVGEEYWFKQKIDKETNIDNAKHLFNVLKQDNRFKYLIIKEPTTFIKYMKLLTPDKIKYVFIFQDIISDSYVNNIKLNEMIEYCKKIEKDNNVNFYPGIDVTNLFASKRYYKTLTEHMKYSILPHSVVLKINKFNGKDDNEKIVIKLFNISKKMLLKFNKIVIKKGYSYNEIQVITIYKSDIKNFKKFTKKVITLDKKDFFDKIGDAKKWEVGMDRYYIIQGYNEIITDATNEYRIFFIDGKPTYIAWGIQSANQCVSDVKKMTDKYIYNVKDIDSGHGTNLINSDEESIKDLENYNSEITRGIIKFSEQVFTDFLKYFWKNKLTKYPIVFRIDASWAEDDIFQDKYSVQLKNSKKIRFYVNELEIDPTHFFYNNLFCKTDKKINSKFIQQKVGKLIIDYINTLEENRFNLIIKKLF
jgi:hypothetical protein